MSYLQLTSNFIELHYTYNGEPKTANQHTPEIRRNASLDELLQRCERVIEFQLSTHPLDTDQVMCHFSHHCLMKLEICVMPNLNSVIRMN